MKEKRDLKEGMESLQRELRDKNEEIESILLNSVSKETFVRNQFQVRGLRRIRGRELQEKIRELERQLRNKSHESDDWKENYEISLKNIFLVILSRLEKRWSPRSSRRGSTRSG